MGAAPREQSSRPNEACTQAVAGLARAQRERSQLWLPCSLASKVNGPASGSLTVCVFQEFYPLYLVFSKLNAEQLHIIFLLMSFKVFCLKKVDFFASNNPVSHVICDHRPLTWTL